MARDRVRKLHEKRRPSERKDPVDPRFSFESVRQQGPTEEEDRDFLIAAQDMLLAEPSSSDPAAHVDYVDEALGSNYVAFMNLDWDHIKASDIFMLIKSFLPSTGTLLSVRIYQSKYGHRRLEEERCQGPPLNTFIQKSRERIFKMYLKSAVDGASEMVNTKQAGFVADAHTGAYKDLDDYFERNPDREEEAAANAVRRYELDRLRYYYALAEVGSPETASAVYSQLDNFEFERSSCTIDARIVTAEDYAAIFAEHGELMNKPERDGGYLRDTCLTEPTVYHCKNDFETKALQKTRPELNWDVTDPDRLKVTMRRYSQEELERMEENPVDLYIASDHENEGNVETGKADAQVDYAALLADIRGDSAAARDGLAVGLAGCDDAHGTSAAKSACGDDIDTGLFMATSSDRRRRRPCEDNDDDFIIDFQSALEGPARASQAGKDVAPELTPFQKYLQSRKGAPASQKNGKALLERNAGAELLIERPALDKTEDTNFNKVVLRKVKRIKERVLEEQERKNPKRVKRLEASLERIYKENPWIRAGANTAAELLDDTRFADVLGDNVLIDTTAAEYKEGGDMTLLEEARRLKYVGAQKLKR